MKTLRRYLPCALLFVVAATPAHAQRAPSGIGASASTLYPSSSLGGGAFVGGGADLLVGLSPRVALKVSGGMYRGAVTEEGTPNEVYNLLTPSVGVRGSLFGTRSDIALVAEAGAHLYSFADGNRLLAASTTIPVVGFGASVRFPVAGPLHVELSAMDRMSYARSDEFGARAESRGLAHSVELKVGVQALRRPREARVTDIGKLPTRFENDFRPIEASTVVFEPNHTSGGRDHAHVGDGESRRLDVVSADVLSGERSINGSVLVDAGAHMPVTEHLLGTVFFESASAGVAKKYQSLLGDVAVFLEQNPGVRLEMRGYTDAQGGGRFNLSLGEERGTAVQDLLVRLYNISPERVSVKSLGVDYRANEEAHARRVDLVARVPVR